MISVETNINTAGPDIQIQIKFLDLFMKIGKLGNGISICKSLCYNFLLQYC